MSAVLVVDVGGSHIKVLATGQQESRRADSGPGMSAARMVEAAKELAGDWSWENVSVGVPSPIHGGRVVAEPVNLGDGWSALTTKPHSGSPPGSSTTLRCRHLGVTRAARCCHRPRDGRRLRARRERLRPADGARTPPLQESDVRGLRRRCRPGEARQEAVARRRYRHRRQTSAALEPDYVVLGGGNAKKLNELPANARLGGNADAFTSALGPKGACADRGLADDCQTAVEAEVPLTCAARSHRRSPQSMQRGSTRRTITVLPQAAHRNQPLVATPAGQNST